MRLRVKVFERVFLKERIIRKSFLFVRLYNCVLEIWFLYLVSEPNEIMSDLIHVTGKIKEGGGPSSIQCPMLI